MNQLAFAVGLFALCASAEHAGVVHAGHAGGAAFHGGFHGGFHATAPAGTVVHMHQVPTSRPSPIVNQQHFVRDNRSIAFPSRGEGGRAITGTPARVPPQSHAAIVRNQAVVRNIRAEQGLERAPGRYYWHTVNGVRYAHYYDRWHVNWYGFYYGPHFYWTRWWYGRWWWWDPTFLRWVYWYDGYWWWQAPDGLVYVYVDNAYYPYDEDVGGVTVANPRQKAPVTAAPPSPNAGRDYYSPDNRRMVQVYGPQSSAYLYDITGAQPRFIIYLASNVLDVRFTGGKGGAALQILVDFKDGTFAVFDSEGRSFGGTPEAVKPVQAAPQPPPQPQPGEVPTTPPGGDENENAPPTEPPAEQ